MHAVSVSLLAGSTTCISALLRRLPDHLDHILQIQFSHLSILDWLAVLIPPPLEPLVQ